MTDAGALIGRRVDDVASSVVTPRGVPAVEEIHGKFYVERAMIRIPQDIHGAARHTGGSAVIRGGG